LNLSPEFTPTKRAPELEEKSRKIRAFSQCLLSWPSATLSSIADGGEGRGEEALSFIESARSTIFRFMGSPGRCARKC
jgi:hypothetical protein